MLFKTGLAIALISMSSISFAENYYWGYNPETKKFGFSNQSGEKVGWKEALIGASGLAPKQNTAKTTPATATSNSIVLNSLTSNELLPTLFGRIQLSGRYTSNEVKYPFIAVQQKIDGTNELRFLQQHPTLTYQNANNQTRYLVFVESLQTIGNEVDTCHGCHVKGYLLNFKKNQNGKFELTNPNTQLIDIPSSWGASHLKIAELQNKTQRVGKNVVGAIFETGFTSGSATESYFIMLALQDHKVSLLSVGDAGVSGLRYIESKDREVEYGYQAEYKILASEPNTEFYPIQIKYSGTNWDLKKINKTITKKYDAAKGGYPD